MVSIFLDTSLSHFRSRPKVPEWPLTVLPITSQIKNPPWDKCGVNLHVEYYFKRDSIYSRL